MGFDNECILNIQSLAGEYFCPVCRLLVYPNEALQSQCTHLYCKPCLTYVVSTTRACPYDGYLVTEADSKPLIESNKALAETIDKIAVHCLYHRSGCTWQGSLSECTTHCAGCAFGNSPVVCNRCGTQIVHRQVQEHAQNCPGVQPQAQQAEGVQDATAASGTTAAAEQNKAATIQVGTAASQAQPTQVASATSTTAPSSGQDQSQANVSTQHQAAAVTVPTQEQWYQQQQQHYQQYYQQYPGYDPYQQHYQNYDPYQQQAQQQYQQQAHPPLTAQGQHQPQVYMQPQLQPQAQPPVRPPVQPQLQTNPQAPIAAQPQMQVQVNPQQQPPQMQLHSHPPPQSHQHPQLYPQAQPQPGTHQPPLHAQPQMQQRPQVPHPQMQHPQSHNLSHPQPHPLPQTQPQPQPHPQPQLQQHLHMHPQPQPQPHSQLQPQQQAQPQLQPQPQTRSHPHPHLPAQHPSTPGVTGHQSYPQPQPQPHQQMLPVAPQQHQLHMHPQQGAPQQPPQMRPPQSHVPMQHQQPPSMPLPPQGQHPNMPPAQQQPVHPQAHQPGQPIHPHHGMNPPHQQTVPQQQVHGHPSQSQPFPVQTPGLVQNHSHQSGPFAQQAMQPQLRPQGPPTSLPQHPHANPQLQQNVPVAYGMQLHQSQNHTGRPMMSNHGVPQQLFQQSTGAHVKLVQPSATQSSLNQNYPLRTNVRPQSSSEQQVGYVQPSALQRESTQISSAQVYPEQQAVAAHQKTDAKGVPSFQGADSTELRILKSENDKRSADEEEKSVNEDEGKNIQPNLAAKDISEASKTLQKDSGLLAQEDDSEEPVVKQMVKEEAAIKSEPSTGEQEDAPHSSPKQDENSLQEDKQSEDAQIQKNPEGLDVKMNMDATDSQLTSMGSVTGACERNNFQTPLNRDPLQQPPRQNMPGHNERNIPHPQFPRQGPASEEHLPPPPGQIQGNSLLQPGQLVPDRRQLPIHYRPPHMQDRAHQRPPAPDQMLQPSMPPPNLMQGLGQPPSHMRPQGHNPLSGPESFRPPIASQSHGPFHPGVPTGGFPAAGSSTSFGRGPGMLGPQRSFELQSAQGHHNQGHLPPPHGSEGHFGQHHTANPVDADRFANKRPGYFDGRQPDLHLPGSAERVPFGQPGSQPNNMKLSGAPGKELAGGVRDPSFPYGLQEERFKSLPEERYRRLEEEGFNRLPEEQFKSFSMESNRRIIDRREFEEDLKQFPGPGHLDGERAPKYENYFSSSRPLDRVPHDLDRAPHGYSHDVGPKLDGGPSTAASRLLPPYHPGGSSVHSVRPIGFHDDNMGRKIDPTGVHPDFLRRAPEAGRHLLPPRSPGREFPRFGPGNQSRLEDIDGRESRMFGERFKSFNLPSDGSGFHDSRFPNLPSHLRRGEPDGHLPVHLRSGNLVGPDLLPSHLRGVESVGPRNLPSHLRNGEPGGFGGFPSHLRMGEPGNLPLNPHIGEAIGANLTGHARGGEPGFSSTYPFRGHPTDGGFFNAGDVESFDQSRKRKHRSMGWCRICKVDCETVEGLELHSQTREHQKMAMDMVLSIKQDSAKKQKSSSDDHVSHEDANKSKKASFESRGSRH